MRSAIALVLAAVAVASCTVVADPIGSPPTTRPFPSTTLAPPVTTPPTTQPTTTTTEADGPVAVRPVASCPTGAGNPSDAHRLVNAGVYRFGEFAMPVTLDTVVANWEVMCNRQDRIVMRWRGASGAEWGELVLSIFGLASGPVSDAWARIETDTQRELDQMSETLVWSATGTGQVGAVSAEWREVRTGPTRPSLILSQPCVIDLPGARCIWWDSTARIYVVPLDDLTVTIQASEERCSCDLGGLGIQDDPNELANHIELLEEILASLVFEP